MGNCTPVKADTLGGCILQIANPRRIRQLGLPQSYCSRNQNAHYPHHAAPNQPRKESCISSPLPALVACVVRLLHLAEHPMVCLRRHNQPSACLVHPTCAYGDDFPHSCSFVRLPQRGQKPSLWYKGRPHSQTASSSESRAVPQ